MKTKYMNWVTNTLEEGVQKSANNIVWVEFWIRNYLEQRHISKADNQTTFNMSGPAKRRIGKFEKDISAKPYKKNSWRCTIYIPIVEKTVIVIAKTEINAMVNAADKAAKLINEYLDLHPEFEIHNNFKYGHWQIIGDKNGNYVKMGLSDKANKKESIKKTDMLHNSMKKVENLVSKIGKTNRSFNNLVIQVFSKDLFGKNVSKEEIFDYISNKMHKEYGMAFFSTKISENKEYVIVVGYTNLKSNIKIGG